MKYIQKGSLTYWQAISALFLGSFATFALLYCTQPLIPIFSTEFQITPAAASLSVSFATGFLAVSMLGMSWLSAAKGRKLIMTVSLLGSAILAVTAAFSNNFFMLLAIRALQGMLLAGFPAIAMAYINEEFPESDLGLVMGIYVSGTSVGGLAGRIIVSTLTDFFSWHVALTGIGLISVLISSWFWFSLPNSRNFLPKKWLRKELLLSLAKNFSDWELIALYSIGFLTMGGFVTLYNYIGYPLMAPPYNLSQSTVGCIFMVYLVGTLSATFMGKLADRSGGGKVLCLAIGMMVIGCILTLNADLYLKILGVAVFTFGFFGSHSVASSWVGRCAGSDKAQASSLYLLFYYMGSSVIGAVGGKFLSWYGWNGVVFLISMSLLLALLLAASLINMRSKIEGATDHIERLWITPCSRKLKRYKEKTPTTNNIIS